MSVFKQSGPLNRKSLRPTPFVFAAASQTSLIFPGLFGFRAVNMGKYQERVSSFFASSSDSCLAYPLARRF